MANSTNPAELLDAWSGWHRISPPMRKDFAALRGAVESRARASWGSRIPARCGGRNTTCRRTISRKELDRLWEQVRPLYVSLHSYVRWKLHEKYGDVVPASGPIPAHLLGNIWAQDWANVYKLVAPADADPGLRPDGDSEEARHQAARYGALRRGFFQVAGICAAAADVLGAVAVREAARSRCGVPRQRLGYRYVEDLRIKMCIDITEEDFTTIHHELGHNFYQRAYDKQPFLFRDSANDGFHEAIGDTIALSVTPEYLVKIGLLDKAPDASKDIGLLLSGLWRKSRFCRSG